MSFDIFGIVQWLAGALALLMAEPVHSWDTPTEKGGDTLETAKEKFMDDRPNWEAIVGLRELEKVSYTRLANLVEDGNYDEAGQVLGILERVGLV